jgi:hypothetical protein
LEGGDEEAADETEDEDVTLHGGLGRSISSPTPGSARFSGLLDQILNEERMLRFKPNSSLPPTPTVAMLRNSHSVVLGIDLSGMPRRV